jgi:hypothetical protein
MKLSQKNFDKWCKAQELLAEALNHRMTKIEKDVGTVSVDMRWIKKIQGWQAGLLSAIFMSLLGLAIKVILFS